MPASEPLFKGQLLLDSGRLRGSFFERAVVLVCEVGPQGAVGLVLNRASGTNVGGMLVPGLPETLKAYPLFVGGPVEPSALSFLRTEDRSECSGARPGGKGAGHPQSQRAGAALGSSS